MNSPADERELKLRYGGRIVTSPKRTNAWGKRRGIQDALVDLLLLSKSDEILATHWSSFSWLAGKLGRRNIT
jgi:hypothetical protein